MKESLSIVGIVIGAVIVSAFVSGGSKGTSSAEYSVAMECYDALQESNQLLDEYKDALSTANSTIEQINNDIGSAQVSVDGDYNEINDALNDLGAPQTVSVPLGEPSTCASP